MKMLLCLQSQHICIYTCTCAACSRQPPRIAARCFGNTINQLLALISGGWFTRCCSYKKTVNATNINIYICTYDAFSKRPPHTAARCFGNIYKYIYIYRERERKKRIDR